MDKSTEKELERAASYTSPNRRTRQSVGLYSRLLQMKADNKPLIQQRKGRGKDQNYLENSKSTNKKLFYKQLFNTPVINKAIWKMVSNTDSSAERGLGMVNDSGKMEDREYYGDIVYNNKIKQYGFYEDSRLRSL